MLREKDEGGRKVSWGRRRLMRQGLAVAGLADRYTKTQTYDPAEYYAPTDDYAGYEDDNNER